MAVGQPLRGRGAGGNDCPRNGPIDIHTSRWARGSRCSCARRCRFGPDRVWAGHPFAYVDNMRTFAEHFG